jgi:hypothetical protein
LPIQTSSNGASSSTCSVVVWTVRKLGLVPARRMLALRGAVADQAARHAAGGC